MSFRLLIVFASIVVAGSTYAQVISDADVKAFHECEQATRQGGNVSKAIDACLAPAKAGIPGAQYALGALLINRNQGGDKTAGIEWLEKATATGNPAAAFVLAGELLQDSAPASQSRARDLLKAAICAGYPRALEIVKKQGVTVDQIRCADMSREDFSGEWIADLKYLKSGAPATDDTSYQFKIVLSADGAHVFGKRNSDWFEAKPGHFKIEKLQQSVILSALDSGWDFEGEWIESWTIALMRVGADEARVTFMRTVNNLHIPKSIPWSSFSSFSEGTAHRGH